MYYRLCKGLADKGNLIPVNEDIYKYVKDFNKDFYVSLYKYSEEHKRLFDERGSVAGIEDTVTNSLLWDFDSEDAQKAIDDSIKLVERLEENNISKEYVEIYFSGNKGVHVAVNLEESLTPKEFKSLTKKLASGLRTYDSSVSNPSRIIRVPFTKHQQTGLYKTRITLDELKSGLDYIMQIAKEEYEPVPFNKPIKLPETIKEYKSEIEKEAEEVPEKKEISKDTVDLGENPFNLSPWKHALAKGYFPMGDRSNALIILCATYKGKGLDKNDTYYLLKSAADKQSELNSNEKFPKEEIWKNIINVVYNPLWKGGTFTEDNFPESLKNYLMELGIQRAINEDEEADVVDVTESLLGFSKYAENIEENTIKSGIKSLDDKIRLQTGNLYGILAPPGLGKCLKKDTPVMLYSGEIVPVQDVKEGDLLMGDDSTPRKVLSTCRGRETMYKVNPVKGDSYTVNESHILSLKYNSTRRRRGYGKGDILNVSIKEYFDLPKSFRVKLKGYRVPVEFKEKKVDFDPYLIGLWLGDGTRTKPEITNTDVEVQDYIKGFCESNGYKLNITTSENRSPKFNIVTERGQTNPFLNETRKCLYNGHKRIPKEYLINSRENRLKLLAGLIDTDGYLSGGCYDYVTKDEPLKDDILYLCRSLGFAAYSSDKYVKGEKYYRLTISGNLNQIPVKVERRKCGERNQIKDVLVTGITVEKLEEDDYYGFEIDGNHLFLLGDFTVTHNTSFALELLNNTSKFGVDGAYFSYDMAENILTQKLIIRELGFESEEVFDIFKNKDKEKIKLIKDKLGEEYKNATFCYKTGQTIDQLKYTIRKAERKRGREIKLVIVDYLELILTDFSDPTQGSAAAIQGLREVANSMNKCVFVLLQPNKISSKPNEPLTSYNSAKGSSAIAQAVTAMITCHRPGYSSTEPEKDKFFSINCVKNRMGPLFALDFKWEGRRGLISELQDSERAELRTIREQLRMEKEIESDPFTH